MMDGKLPVEENASVDSPFTLLVTHDPNASQVKQRRKSYAFEGLVSVGAPVLTSPSWHVRQPHTVEIWSQNKLSCKYVSFPSSA